MPWSNIKNVRYLNKKDNLPVSTINLNRIVFQVTRNPDVGMWLSLVEHSVRDAGVGGSNPLIPTN